MNRPAEGPPPIASHRHPVAVRLRKLSRRPVLARREGVFLLDGVHLLEEALSSPHVPETILIAPRLDATAPGQALRAAMTGRGWPLLRVTDELLESVAPTTTPQGVLGLFRRPSMPGLPQPVAHAPGAAALILAGLQDPANLGAIARAARVFACPLLITLAGTVDPYHPRATRASSGSLLHLTIVPDAPEPDLRSWVEQWRVRAVALVPRDGRAIPARAPGDPPLALVLGSEGAGIPPAVEALCSERWSIPMAEGAESLGVAAAGAIALYAARAEEARDPRSRGIVDSISSA
jgi:TrmH family RNA methyltransferase